MKNLRNKRASELNRKKIFVQNKPKMCKICKEFANAGGEEKMRRKATPPENEATVRPFHSGVFRAKS